MQLSTSEISELIKSRLENFSTTAEARTQGTVVSVTDGIVRIHGLSNVMSGEMIEFPGNTYGLALNLERDSVGARSACRPRIDWSGGECTWSTN
jgi:F-type H+-transporting ATPase subunit alpha